MRVRVRYFGSAKDDAGTDIEEINIANGGSLSDFKRILYEEHPSMKTRSGNLLFAVNQAYSDDSRKLSDGDEIAVFPVVSGG